jgi:hypothetical protein
MLGRGAPGRLVGTTMTAAPTEIRPTDPMLPRLVGE